MTAAGRDRPATPLAVSPARCPPTPAGRRRCTASRRACTGSAARPSRPRPAAPSTSSRSASAWVERARAPLRSGCWQPRRPRRARSPAPRRRPGPAATAAGVTPPAGQAAAGRADGRRRRAARRAGSPRGRSCQPSLPWVSSAARRDCRARCAVDFTVPVEQPSTSAISCSLRSS